MTVPLPIITALVGALAGAIIGGIVSDFITRRREQRSRRIRLVGELAAFSGRCEGALIRFQRVRAADKGSAYSEQTYVGLADLADRESEGHRLYWDIREAYNSRQIASAVWELTRRISLTKQLLLFSAGHEDEFAAGLGWINSQSREVLTLCGKTIGLKTHKDPFPFFLGLGGAGADKPEYRSPEQPWEAMSLARAEELAERMWAERHAHSSAPETDGMEPAGQLWCEVGTARLRPAAELPTSSPA
ncbi:MAG TPA: hypothetical protein VEK57_08295 [Thermoanaerobaculia bacterium]|nr:hypothetical protein [Thermoanaerobaculia bacterium]